MMSEKEKKYVQNNFGELIATDDFYNFTKECYEIYGAYVNNFRSIPGALDGLKPVQRRVIYSAICDPRPKKTQLLASATLDHHPHGEQSIKPVVDFLVRKGILDGQGNFGGNKMDGTKRKASAGRYTSAWINPRYYKLFSKLLQYAPTYIGEFGKPQPHFIPTPVPLCLTFGSEGIGIGCNQYCPPFTPESLLRAYYADDYHLLEVPYGYKIDKEDLKELWEGDSGHITWNMDIVPDYIEGRKGYAIVGNPEIFAPTITADIQEWIDEGRVFFADYSTEKEGRLVYAIAPRVSYPTEEDLLFEMNRMKSCRKHYAMKSCYGGKVYKTSIRDWIDCTHTTYVKMFDMYKEDQLTKLRNLIPVYENFTKVAEMLIAHKSDAEIIKTLKIEDWIVKAIARKTLRVLQTLDPNKKLVEIKNDIKVIEASSGKQFIIDVFLEGKDVDFNTSVDKENTPTE